MLWQRYWRVFAWSIPAGAAIGVLFALSIYLIGNIGASGSLFGLLSLLLAGTLLGAVTAVAAVAGSYAALGIWDRTLTRDSMSRVVAAAIGAGLGVIVMWVALGVFNGLVSLNGWAWFPIAGFLAAVTAPISAVLSGTLIHRADKRAAKEAVVIAPPMPRPGDDADPDDEIRIDFFPHDRS